MISSCGLEQYVTTATHVSEHILDLVMTRAAADDDLIRLCEVGLRHGSDHNLVSCILQQRKQPPQKAKCSVRNFRNMTPSAFKSDLESKLTISDTLEDVNDLVEHFSSVSKTVLDLHATQCTRICIIRPRPGGIMRTLGTKNANCAVQKEKGRKRKLQVDRDAYMIQHEKVVKLIELSKEEYFKSILHDCSSKITFKTLGVLLNNNSRILPTFDTPDKLCNKFAIFFTDKVDKIRKDIDSSTCNTYSETNVDRIHLHSSNDSVITSELVTFKALSDKEMFDIIMGCANKTCSLDCMPTWLLKSNTDVVVPYVKDIVNMSLRDGVFPHSLKQAIVTPIIKKTTLDWNELRNYRPVSNITFIGKVIEKAMISQFNEHMEKNNLNEVFQSAYKNEHSAETALLKVKDDIPLALDKNHATFLIMLDLSAAFDIIDHGILFHQFEHDFGIKGTALQWFKSYMSGRTFRVCISGEMSESFTLDYGVPQGSKIGPRAFTKYAQVTSTQMIYKCITPLTQSYLEKLHVSFLSCLAVLLKSVIG